MGDCLPADFVLEWEKALGYKGDPFTDKVLIPSSQFLVNREIEKERINWFFIKGYFYGVVLGEHGVGKTTLLKWLQERLNKYNKIHCIYINAAAFRDQVSIHQQILMPLLSFYEKAWSKPHQKFSGQAFLELLKKKLGAKSVALLIDNAHNLTDKNIELLKGLREEGLRLQVIAASVQADYEKSRLMELGSDELSINLRRLNFEESKEMIARRVMAFGGVGFEPFSEDTLSFLYEKADKNPRQFIHFCRDEAIKLMIQKKGLSKGQGSSSGEKKIDTARAKFKEHKATARAERNVYGNLSSQTQSKAESANSWKSPLRIRFDFGSQKTVVNRHADSGGFARQQGQDAKRVLASEKHSQDLLGKLSSARSKKRQDQNY
jgi:type II secretory pathway predicted ATPase ExeA